MQQQATLIVGIGASAGGISALKAFFSEVQATPEMAFVVVTHLSPNRESLLHNVIRNFTTLPVEVINDGDPVRAGVVHVMPQNVSLSIKDGHLRLLELDPALRERKPIDVFFSALAIDQEERAVGIVLSGGDGDGTIGVRAIKDRGGITFAQVGNGSGPDNPEMPESAIASGSVDFALPVEQMPQKLADLQKAAASLGPALRRGELDITVAGQRHLQDEISLLLHEQSGRDFAGYKTKPFFRRVARRMQVVLTPTPEAYLERLRKDPAEVMALFRDLLISVTDFFRDEGAFKALSTNVMPSLLAKRGADDTVRVWVPGCATGEEVYSLAVLIREHMDGLSAHPKVQVFGTDIDTHALTLARAGRYPDPLLRSVSDERKARFFRRDGASWVIAPEIRDMCIFSAHSLTSDPPFAQMDLVSCRNLLIYLETKLQQRVIPTFHYALKPGGFLFLGSSESIGKYENLFVAINKKHRIFQSLNHGDRRLRIPIPMEELRKVRLQFEPNDLPQRMTTHRVRQRAEHQIVEGHSPAHLVVRSDGDIIYFSARTRRYFDIPRGAPSKQLFDLVRRELRQDLRSALREVLETNKAALRQTVLSDDDAALHVALVVEPLNNGGDGEAMFLIVFRPFEGIEGHKEKASYASGIQVDSEAAERELRDLHERLQSTIEEYETTLEELNTSNEELASVNEEMQSTNEELQASKEEMQSLNEELSIVNAELNDKVDELERANTDLQNLYGATGISSIFLDLDMMIRSFTPAAAMFFKLRKSDIGRPLTELASTIDYPALKSDIRQVLETGKTFEHQLPSKGLSEHYLMRANPYFEREAITGVVVTFVDITNLVHAEEQRAALIAEAAKRAAHLKEVSAADARKARLMAALAHDLRTPLIAILGTLDLLPEGPEKRTDDRMLLRLKADGHGMLHLIDDVLELARLGAGEARLRPEPFAPAALLEQVGDLVRVSAARHDTEVVLHVERLPMLMGDVMSLKRVLLNFATNAVKATRGGSVRLSAALDAAGSEGHTVTFTVSDTGCGIAPEHIPRLFRDFGMLEREGPAGDGTGLGLAICRRLAAAMGGEVGVESTLGVGSHFWLRVTLPKAEDAGSAANGAKDDCVAALAGLRVLVAEDHEIIRQLTCSNLARVGMVPSEAADGLIAVQMAEAQEFDLILMDLQMPRLDGDEAAARIRNGGGLSANARIIGITAHQSPEIAVMLSDLAFDACLRKPLDIQKLAALMSGGLSPSPGAASPQCFDTDNLEQLREIAGGTLLVRTLKGFAVEVETTRTELAALIAKRDMAAAGFLVHKLVGFSDMLGARMLSAELRKFEELICDEDITALEAALDWVNDVMNKTQVEVKNLIDEADRGSSGEDPRADVAR